MAISQPKITILQRFLQNDIHLEVKKRYIGK